jgi:hypothetical protein
VAEQADAADEAGASVGASQLIRRVGRTCGGGRDATRLTAILLTCLAACRAGDVPRAGVASSPSSRPSTAPTTVGIVPSTVVGLYGGAFSVPRSCTVECTACIVPLQGVIKCPDDRGLTDPSGTFMHHADVRGVDEPVVIRKLEHVPTGFVYSGESRQGRGFCSAVRVQSPTRGTWAVWDFCSHSRDARVEATLRSIAESFQPDPGLKVPTPCEVGAF